MRVAIVLGVLAAALFLNPGFSSAKDEFDNTPEALIKRMQHMHSAHPYKQITFDMNGTGSTDTNLPFGLFDGTCTSTGKGSFNMQGDGRVVVKVDEIRFSCSGLVHHLEGLAGKKMQEYFTLPELNQFVKDGQHEMTVLLPHETDAASRDGFIPAVAPGTAAILSAHRDLIEYALDERQLSESTRSSPVIRRLTILRLHQKDSYLQYFNDRLSKQKVYTQGALIGRITMDRATGKFLSLAVRWEFGGPDVLIEHEHFQGRWWLWKKFSMTFPAEWGGAKVVVRLEMNLSNYNVEPRTSVKR